MPKTTVMNSRVFNFGAGPAMLPEEILKEAQEEFLNWRNTGMSILEIGHRTPEIINLLSTAEQSLRELLNIPKNYHVLFLGGAARAQFAMIPMNLLQPGDEAAYFITGIWSKMAYHEANLLKQAYYLSNEEKEGFVSIPDYQKWELKSNTAYVYYTPNETINGVRFPYVPKTGGVPLVADMTSCLLSEPININQYGLIFAGAQKNIANAGLTVVIIHEDLLKNQPEPVIPTMLNYKNHAEHRSLYATPPVFNCYLASKMFEWIKTQGGIDGLFQRNCLKAAKLYQYLDSTDFYLTPVSKEARSIMNICFSLCYPDLEQKFLDMANERGLKALKGHRFTGGLRASLYNAMPMAGVDALIEFMSEFAKENG
ncbi:TPA: 3-phosphoserine/phosphohydroxythreonine transaminase [Legionella pneumophila]|nr:3-phosphoserine/phosphohydroxythreonine transaminase [Legionella pneumophila]HAT8916355.1 3-phosphoserine/phosphohydroxythreonine transaminase [Legionella pneumophila subsp. pneumophila]PYB54730.1 3-phosphoserine/phosphohydroxythreonine transaminase [Legionella pneumophila]PYB65247.1 3-phosphoserine/phosphohydroxythreonine transaminase [Legionella pneumophila]TID62588.1 3-phosphoserine/phosphohydroxythreonine transaminase [Legionella pneumophila]